MILLEMTWPEAVFGSVAVFAVCWVVVTMLNLFKD